MTFPSSPRARTRITVVMLLLPLVAFVAWEWNRGPNRTVPVPLEAIPTVASSTVAASPDATPTRVDSEEVWDVQLSGQPSSITLALDEAVLRDAQGKEHVQKLSPPATQETLPSRLAALSAPLGVFPVAYLAGQERSENSRRLVTPDLRVQLDAGVADQVAKAHRLVVKDRPNYAPGWVIMSAGDAFAALDAMVSLRTELSVASADVLLAVQHTLRALPNDPLIGDQWHLKGTAGRDLNIESVWNYPSGPGIRGVGVRIGIVDDGLQTNHPDLTANMDTVNDKDWNDGDADPSPGTGDDHGTSCGGNAAARANNAKGVSGTAPEATLVGMRLIAASVTDAQEAEAMSYLPAIIQIRSNSWGPSDTGNVLEGPGALAAAAFQTAATSGRGGKGNIFLWAAGNGGDVNDNSNYDGYANSIYTIAIGATDSAGNRAYYAEPGSNVVVCAPSSGDAATTLGITTVDRTDVLGYNTATSANGGDYTNDFGGTSSATPTAAGAVALMLEKNPNLGWRDVQEILIRSAFKVKPADADWTNNSAGFHFNHDFGAGLIDAAAAVSLATGWNNLPAQISSTSTQTGLTAAIANNNAAGVTRTFDLSATSIRVEQLTLKLSATHTARGNLAITLTSPSGMSSRLAEVHSDSGDHYSNWKFSSVRHWGEISTGTWTLKVADLSSTGNSTGGTLTAAELQLFGTPGVPVNPPPQVQITHPTDAQVFSPGATVVINATATDLTSTGAAGSVTEVQFLDNNVVIGTDSTAPYSFTWAPSLGNHLLTVTATDSESAVGTSAAVPISVVNQAPTITAANLSATDLSYADVPLNVVSVSATDPEGSALTYSYQWQSSVNQTVYSNEPATTATAPALPGRLLRCLVTASDGNSTSAPFVTATVNLLARPLTTGTTGNVYSYTSGLVLKGTESSLSRRAILHEFSQGPVASSSEWIEILTLQAGGLASWSVEDAAANKLVFSNGGVWNTLPAGTLVVVYNGASKDPLLPADDADPADGRMVVSSTDAALFAASSNAWLPLGNSGDSLFLKDPQAATVHAVAYGNSTTAPMNVGSVGSGKSAYFAGDTDAGASEAANWRVTSSLTARALRDLTPNATLSGGNYAQNFDTLPGAAGTAYPEGWTSYNNATVDNTMAVGTSTTTAGGNYNYGSRLGLLGSSSAFDPGSLVLALANTTGATGLKISFDVIKIREQSRSMSFKLQVSTTSATTGFTDVPGAAHSSAAIAEGTTTSFSSIPLPASIENSATTVYFRWLYATESGTGSRDGLALDNVVISTGTAVPTLTLNITPTTFAENLGVNAATATLSIPAALPEALTVALASSDTSEATVPATVSIPAGQTSVTFAISAVDDTDSDGPQTATISATATGFISAANVITITDNEISVEGVTPGNANNSSNQVFLTKLRNGGLNSPALFRIGSGATVPEGLTLDPQTGILGGTLNLSNPAGPYTITIERYNSLGEVVSQTYTLTLAVGTGNTYAAWISGYPVNGITAPNADFDKDGLPNAIENFLGTSPTSFSHGLTPISQTPTQFVFRHTRSNTLATDLTVTYEWSPNLATWYPSGTAASGSGTTTTVTLVPTIITDRSAPEADSIEVVATRTGTPIQRFFVRIRSGL